MNTVIVTGGTKGIGAEIANKFLLEGWQVVIGARNKSGLATKQHERLEFQQIDVRNELDHADLVKKALDLTGRLDCFINCAGYSKWFSIGEVSENDWDHMIDVNLKGVFFGCKAASKNLSSGGSIVNISSLAGKRGSANNSVYCASKFGVNGITQSLSKELGERKIRVNAICPVYIETEGLMDVLDDSDAPPRGQNPSDYLHEFAVSNAALQRIPKASEIADLSYYLASPGASAITGQCINIDCGVLPQ